MSNMEAFEAIQEGWNPETVSRWTVPESSGWEVVHATDYDIILFAYNAALAELEQLKRTISQNFPIPPIPR